MKKIMTLTCVGLLTMGLAACDNETQTKTTEKAVINGTTYETTTKTERSVDDGVVTKEVETTKTIDPEGLMNKKTMTESYETETETYSE